MGRKIFQTTEIRPTKGSHFVFRPPRGLQRLGCS